MASWELAEKKTTWGKLILVLIGEANLMNIYVLMKLPQPCITECHLYLKSYYDDTGFLQERKTY